MGKYGMAVDNLLSAEVVLASGEVVTASEDGDRDLFWALRGGGGNFGVVTSFEYRTHRVASVLGGAVLHPLSAAPQLFSFYREFAADLPDELSTQAAFLHAPDGSGTKLCGIAVCHAADDPDRAESDVLALRRFGSPAADMIERMPYPAVNTGLDWLAPAGVLGYWKSAFFSELSDPAVAAMASAFERSPSALCAMAVEDFHGAVTRVPPTATAYPHREPGFNLLLISTFEAVEAVCPSNTVPWGAGAHAYKPADNAPPTPTGQLGLQLMRTDGALGIARATARESANGYNGSTIEGVVEVLGEALSGRFLLRETPVTTRSGASTTD